MSDGDLSLPELIKLGFDEGRTVREIADILGITIHTVYGQCYRHKIRLPVHLNRSRSLESGERFRASRKAKGWTQDYAAEVIGVSVQTIKNWENGSLPKPYLAECAAKAYGVTMGWLIDEEIVDKEA